MEKPKKNPFNFKRITIGALCLMIFDAYIMGTLSIGFLITLIYSVGSGLQAFFYLFKDRPRAKLHLKKGAIFFLALCIIVGVFRFNNHIGSKNAEKIIFATTSYHADTKKWPDNLEQLVPKYLDAIPVSAYRSSNNRFMYFVNDDGDPYLSWTTFPPFGRQVYNFKEDKWTFLD